MSFTRPMADPSVSPKLHFEAETLRRIYVRHYKVGVAWHLQKGRALAKAIRVIRGSMPLRVVIFDEHAAVTNREKVDFAVHAFCFRCPMWRRSISSISRITCACGMPLPSANSRREISTSLESSRDSIKLSKSVALTRYEAARPFWVTRMGRCVSCTRPMYAERLLRHSEKGTTSSDGRQRRTGISRVTDIFFEASCISVGAQVGK